MAKDSRNQILDVSFEDLPNEILSKILSYFSKKKRLSISTVNQRWFQNINSQIEDIQIRRPTTTNENLEELQRFINRFRRLRSLSLDSRVGNYSELLPLKSLNLKGISIEFDVRKDLIKTKNDVVTIKRIKLEDFEDFTHFEYKPSQIIVVYVDDSEDVGGSDSEMLREEIMSLNSLRRIYISIYDEVISRQVYEAILTRPALKQIDIDAHCTLHCTLHIDNIEHEIPKNYTVEEITFDGDIFHSEKWKKLFDALPNIKRVRVVQWGKYPPYNLPEFIKVLSVFKNLESLHIAIARIEHEGPKIQDSLKIIKDNFPIKAKVVIADMDGNAKLTNVIEKEEGKLPEIVRESKRAMAIRYPLYGSSFLPKPMWKTYY